MTGSTNVAMSFNSSALGRWINGPAGRAFRLAAGSGFLLSGLRHRRAALGKVALAWSIFPLSAGALDLCWISAALGGPLRGKECREAARLRGAFAVPKLESFTAP